MEDVRISVIIPVYNAEKYLRKCLDSMLAQTFTFFEVLLVNDGSTDNSKNICDEYARKDRRIRKISQKNGGVTSARYTGFNNICNETQYIIFVDADDFLPLTALADLYEATDGGRYDIVVGRIDDGKYKQEFLTKEENRSFAIANEVIPCALWARLINRNLFNDEIFNIPRSIIRGEDMLMNIRLSFVNQKNVKLLSKKVYCYVKHSDSCTGRFRNTFEYEIFYDGYRINSIPKMERERYRKECLCARLKSMEDVVNWQRRNVWSESTFFREVMEEVQSSNYPLSFYKRLKLNLKNSSLLKIIIYAELLYRKILHRLRDGICR